MTDSMKSLIDANAFEAAGDPVKAIQICEAALDGTEFPDHYLTLARNYFNLAHAGDETYAWRALLAALEGIDRRAKQQQQTDTEFAVGIVKWVLEHFSDWNRRDVSVSDLQSIANVEKAGVESRVSMAQLSRECADFGEGNESMTLANSLYRASPLVIRPGRSGASVEREARYALATQVSTQSDIDAGAYLKGLGLPVPGDYECQLYDKYLYTSARAELSRLQAKARGVPAIMLTCMPKSASEYLSYTLADTLAAPIVRATIGYPTSGVVVEEWLREIIKGGCVFHDHFGGRPENIAALRACNVGEIVVLVRDPRAVALSLINMSEEFGVPLLAEKIMPGPDGKVPYFVRLARMFSQWIESWIVAKEQGMNVKFVTFKLLTAYPEDTMGMILDQFGAGAYKGRLQAVLAAKGKGSNFRNGDDSAWRRRIPPAMADDAWIAIPPTVRNLLDLEP